MNGSDKFRPSVDHIIPRALGGTHDPENLQLTHLVCNLIKHDRIGIPQHYFARRYSRELRHIARAAQRIRLAKHLKAA
jgi:5-methylcytosine-specific restriction endonuclease McrA